MGEFGHTSIRLPGGGIADCWGRGPYEIDVGGKIFRFEDSDRFGPALIKKDGELRENPYPSERPPFWEAHRAWVKQGRRTKRDKVTCIWDEAD